jgi:hypothetical protein
MRISNRVAITLLVLSGAAFGFATPARAGSDWPPIVPEELAMKDNPANPGSQAMVLYREEIVNNKDGYEDYYYRIKVFTEEGKKRADIQIEFIKGYGEVKDIRARTIHPDGKIIEFDGHPLEKLIVKADEIKVQAKTFTMPDVTAGSIIEYRFRIQYPEYLLINSNWYVQDDLFTRRAHFVFIPYEGAFAGQLIWRSIRVPDVKPQKQKDGSWALDVNDVEGAPEEEYMLPVDEVRGRVQFSYVREEHPKEAKMYWDQFARVRFDEQDKFVGKHSEIRDAVTKTVGPDDTPDMKLRKLYARAQQIHNVDTDREKTAQEARREKTKENSNVTDILKHGSGDSGDIDLFFVALAQAAGFDSSLVYVAPRSKTRFHPEMQDSSELSDYLVFVHAGDKDYFLDPGVALCPFGTLPWFETSIQALRATKQGAVFLQTPASPGSNSVTERRAELTLDSDGSLSGTLVIRFTGQRAYTRRRDARHEDETGRNKMITDEIKEWLPSSAKFDLTSITGWDTTDAPLEVQGKLRLPGMAESVGRRMLLPVGLYEAGQRQIFESAKRKQDVYFPFAYSEQDDITVQLPAGWKVETLPKPQVVDPGGQLHYEIAAKQDGNALHLQRSLTVGGILYPVNYYGGVRTFFSSAKGDDEQQIVLQANGSANN